MKLESTATNRVSQGTYLNSDAGSAFHAVLACPAAVVA